MEGLLKGLSTPFPEPLPGFLARQAFQKLDFLLNYRNEREGGIVWLKTQPPRLTCLLK